MTLSKGGIGTVGSDVLSLPGLSLFLSFNKRKKKPWEKERK
jgi:hypothetical protein